jgi:hypothetical protein
MEKGQRSLGLEPGASTLGTGEPVAWAYSSGWRDQWQTLPVAVKAFYWRPLTVLSHRIMGQCTFPHLGWRRYPQNASHGSEATCIHRRHFQAQSM